MALKLADPKKVYAQNTNLKREDVQAIFQWLKKQPHLPELAETQVILFLQSCDYSIEAAKKILDNYFTTKTHCPELCDSANEEIIRAVLATESVSILPKKTPEGYAILHCKLVDCNPEKYFCVNHFKVACMVVTLYLHQHEPVDGVVLLADFKGATFGHLARVNVAAVRNLLYFIQEATPIKLKGIHYVNVVPITEKVINLIKPIMKKEIFNLLHIHSSFESLHKLLPKEYIPVDYDGHLPPTEQLRDESMKTLIDHIDFFIWHDTQKVDESKRTGQSTNIYNTFGMDGTFRKLELD